jgi:hypothetical protein
MMFQTPLIYETCKRLATSMNPTYRCNLGDISGWSRTLDCFKPKRYSNSTFNYAYVCSLQRLTGSQIESPFSIKGCGRGGSILAHGPSFCEKCGAREPNLTNFRNIFNLFCRSNLPNSANAPIVLHFNDNPQHNILRHAVTDGRTDGQTSRQIEGSLIYHYTSARVRNHNKISRDVKPEMTEVT